MLSSKQAGVRPYVAMRTWKGGGCERRCWAIAHSLFKALFHALLAEIDTAAMRPLRWNDDTGSAAQRQHFRCSGQARTGMPISAAGVRFSWLSYGFSTGSRTALPHSVHDPS